MPNNIQATNIKNNPTSTNKTKDNLASINSPANINLASNNNLVFGGINTLLGYTEKLCLVSNILYKNVDVLHQTLYQNHE